jgi:hypothetical protein
MEGGKDGEDLEEKEKMEEKKGNVYKEVAWQLAI